MCEAMFSFFENSSVLEWKKTWWTWNRSSSGCWLWKR